MSMLLFVLAAAGATLILGRPRPVHRPQPVAVPARSRR